MKEQDILQAMLISALSREEVLLVVDLISDLTSHPVTPEMVWGWALRELYVRQNF